jgi:hypothetical protein
MSMFNKDMGNGNVRADMLQKIFGLHQELTEEAPDIYNVTRLVDTVIGRIEMFCKYPATCSPIISIGKPTEDKAPAGSMTVSVLLSSKYVTKVRTNRGAW